MTCSAEELSAYQAGRLSVRTEKSPALPSVLSVEYEKIVSDRIAEEERAKESGKWWAGLPHASWCSYFQQTGPCCCHAQCRSPEEKLAEWEQKAEHGPTNAVNRNGSVRFQNYNDGWAAYKEPTT